MWTGPPDDEVHNIEDDIFEDRPIMTQSLQRLENLLSRLSGAEGAQDDFAETEDELEMG